MYGLRMQSSESVYDVECRTERRSHIPIFKVCMLVNAELNIAPAA